MKSKEEIDELAEEFLLKHQDGSKVYHVKIREAIEFAYNKCQEDMAKELEKETLNELFDAHEPEDFIDENEQNWWEKNKQD